MKRKKIKKQPHDDLDFKSVDPKQLVRVPDFLPPPSELAKAKTLITMNMDQKTLEFFKRIAKKKGGKYQAMMREVLSRYAEYYSKEGSAA